jgi:hypothetical protein
MCKGKKQCNSCKNYGEHWRDKDEITGIGKAEFPVNELKGAAGGVGTGYLLSILGRKFPESVIADPLTRAGIQAGGGLAMVLFTDDKTYQSYAVGLMGSAVIPLAEKIGISGVIEGSEKVVNRITGLQIQLRNKARLAGLNRSYKETIGSADLFIPTQLASRGIGGSELRKRV